MAPKSQINKKSQENPKKQKIGEFFATFVRQMLGGGLKSHKGGGGGPCFGQMGGAVIAGYSTKITMLYTYYSETRL